MDEALRRSAAHVLVADVDAPVLDDADGPPPRPGAAPARRRGRSRSPTAPAAGGRAASAAARVERRRRRRADVAAGAPVTVAVAPAEGRPARVAGAEVHRGRRRPASCCSTPSAPSCAGTPTGRARSSSGCAGSPPRRRCSRGGCGCPRSRSGARPPTCWPAAAVAEPGGRPVGAGDTVVADRARGRLVAGRAGRGRRPRVARRHTCCAVETAAVVVAADA